MYFTIFYNKQRPFQAIKTRSSQSRKIEIFQKELVHGFGQKLAIFHLFISGNIGQQHVFNNSLQQKTPLQAIKTRSSKSQKIQIFLKGLVQNVQKLRFFQRGQSMVLVKNCPLFHFFISGNIGQQNAFYDSLERKNAFLCYTNNKFKKSKN